MNMTHLDIARTLADSELLAATRSLAARERETTAELVAHLAELETRRLHLAAGYSSMFAYCRDVLLLSEDAAGNRITAARTARRFPLVLELLAQGVVSLTAVRLLSPHLTVENHADVLASARGLRTAQIEEIVARLAPKADVPVSIRKLPARAAPQSLLAAEPSPTDGVLATANASQTPGAPPLPGSSPLAAPPPSIATNASVPVRPQRAVSPLSPDRYKLQLTISGATREKLLEAKDLLRHANPSGDEATIIDRALTLLLADVKRKKFGATERPPSPRPRRASGEGSEARRPRAETRRTVSSRDGERCGFVSADGKRCEERGFLEFHHVKPYVRGGGRGANNIGLRCRNHNSHEWKLESTDVRLIEDDWYRQQHVLKRVVSAPRASPTNPSP
jgi:hypothetical protein